MLFGDKAAFALEYDVAEEQPEPFGGLGPLLHVSYWIGGRQVGNPSLPTYSGYLASGLIHHLNDRGHRRNDALFALPAPDLAALLRRPREGAAGQARADEERWSAHEIGQPLDSAEYNEALRTDWDVYVVEGEGHGRVMAFHRDAEEPVVEHEVPSGRIDSVLVQAWRHLEAD